VKVEGISTTTNGNRKLSQESDEGEEEVDRNFHHHPSLPSFPLSPSPSLNIYINMVSIHPLPYPSLYAYPELTTFALPPGRSTIRWNRYPARGTLPSPRLLLPLLPSLTLFSYTFSSLRCSRPRRKLPKSFKSLDSVSPSLLSVRRRREQKEGKLSISSLSSASFVRSFFL